MECKQCDRPNRVVVINIYFLLPIIIKQTLECKEFLGEFGWMAFIEKLKTIT